jgi:ketosteroid isomerase-like protein
MQSRHRVEEFIAAFNRKDIPGALACFTDDAIYQDVTYGTHSGCDDAAEKWAESPLTAPEKPMVSERA